MAVGEFVEPVGHGAHLGRAAFEAVHAGAKFFATGQGTHRPADVLARTAHARACIVPAIQAIVVVEVFEQPGLGLADLGCGEVLTGFEKVRDLAKDPRPALRSAADHDCIGARDREHVTRFFG